MITAVPPSSRGGLVRGLLLATLLLFGVSAAGNGTEESAPSQNLDYQAGLEAIKVSDWKRAIDNLNVALVAEPTNADLRNWLGYALRHEGRYNEAFEQYRAALQLEPKHRGAHEYIGEAYLMQGNLAKAKEHLARLDKLCFFGCEEYDDLKKSIAEYEQRKK